MSKRALGHSAPARRQLTGCGYAEVVNIVRRAMRQTGVARPLALPELLTR
jgi:hypothetical protein